MVIAFVRLAGISMGLTACDKNGQNGGYISLLTENPS